MEIQITYRRTSRLSMRVTKNGDISVSAPVYASRQDIEDFINSHRDWMEKAKQRRQAKEAARQEFFNRLPLSTKKERNEAKSRLHNIIMPMIERYKKEMGVCPADVRYKATVSKWGSCNTATRIIQFSTYLLLLPEWCIEHVVVHELAHLLVPNHSRQFHAVMDRYFPRWREAKKETKSICFNCTQNKNEGN